MFFLTQKVLTIFSWKLLILEAKMLKMHFKKIKIKNKDKIEILTWFECINLFIDLFTKYHKYSNTNLNSVDIKFKKRWKWGVFSI